MDIVELPGILLRRWIYILATAVVCVALAGAYVVLVKPASPVSVEILIDPQGLATEKGDLVPQASGGAQDSAMLESQIYLMQSGEILGDVVDRLKLTEDPFLLKKPGADKELAKAGVVAAMQKNLVVAQQGQSFVLTLTFKHRDPAKAAEIANAIATVYLKKVHQARNEAAARAADAFEVQAQALAGRVRKAENELEAFKAKNQIVSTGQQGLVIDQQVEGVNRQLLTARADLGAKQASYDQARSLTVGSVQDGAIPEALSSTALGTMRARYADLAAQMSQSASSLGANHPQMQAMRSQVAGMQQSIEQELGRIRTSLKSAVDRASANVADLEKRLNELTRTSFDAGEAGIKARELQSEVDTLRALYKTFLSRSQELGQRDLTDTNNSRIISKAIGVASSSSAAKLMILMAAAMFGVIAGSGLAIFREVVGRMFAGGEKPIGREPRPHAQPIAEKRSVQPVAPQDALPPIDIKPVSGPVAPAQRLPIIAHLVERRQNAGLSRFANAQVRNSPATLIGASAKGVAMTVARIAELHPGEGTEMVLILSPGATRPAAGLATELAQGLHRHGFDVAYSSGDEMSDGPGNAHGAPLGEIIAYERLAIAPTPETQAPTFRSFVQRLRRPDIVLVDGRGHVARRHQAALIDKADAILVIATQALDGAALEDFVRSLPEAGDRVIGAVLVEQAA